MALTVPAGAHLGRYEIVKHLASGLMAELLLARARGLEGFERHFVIKRIRAEQERDEAFIEMFLAEARLAASLHHHNIVQVHDIGEDDGKPYFAMEYVHGEDLRRVLGKLFERGEHLPLEHVIAIVCSVAGALHHAHEALGPDRQPLGIVHRDVTPANILLGYDGNVKVVDFGIARAAMRRTETQAGMLVGKAPYMAPEQCVGGTIDRRSDVFALGIVLFELITGRRLFKGENEFLTMSAVVEAKVPPPSAHRSDVMPALDKIVLKALSRDPLQRYQTAEQMFFALDTLASQEGLRSSGLGLAAFMKELFGHRVEPWLGEDDRPRSTSPDFDGAYPGLAAPPTGSFETYTDPNAKKLSPITRARNNAISDQPATVPIAAKIAAASTPQPIGEQRSAAVRIPEGPVPAGRARDKAAFRTTQVHVAPMPTRQRPKTKTVQIPVTKSAEATVEQIEATRVDPMDLLEIPVEPATPAAASIPVKVDSTAPPRKDATPIPSKGAAPPPPPTGAKASPGAAPSTHEKSASTGAKPVSTESASAPNTKSASTGAKLVSTESAPSAPNTKSASTGAKPVTTESAPSAPNTMSVSTKSPSPESKLPAASPRPSSGLSVTAFAQRPPSAAPSTTKLPSLLKGGATSSSLSGEAPSSSATSPPSIAGAASAISSSSSAPSPATSSMSSSPSMTASASPARRNTPPPMPAFAIEGDTKRKTPPPMQAIEAPLEAPPVLAVSSQAMAPVVEASISSSRNLALPSSDFEEPDPETEIDPLASRQGEVAPKSPSIWNNPEMFEPDEPSVVVRSKSLVLAALAAEAARTDAEDARADAEALAVERERADSQIDPPTRVDSEPSRADSEAQTFAEPSEIDDGLGDDGPTRVPGDGGPTRDRAMRAADGDDSIADDGPTSVMPDVGNDVPPPPSAMPAGWLPPGAQLPRPQTPRPHGPPERGSQDRITPLPPPPMMPEITDYPRLRDHRNPTPVPTATATSVQGWMPAAPTVDEAPMSSKRKKLIAGAIGAVLLVAIIALAMRGGEDTPATREGSDSIAKPVSREPAPTETPTPTESSPTKTTPTEPAGTTAPPPVKSPDKTTLRPTAKPPKVTPKVAAKPLVKKPVKKPSVKKPPVKKPPVTKPPKKPEGWDPNSLFPKKK